MRIHALRTASSKSKKALDTAQAIPLVYLATHDHQTPRRLEERRAYRGW